MGKMQPFKKNRCNIEESLPYSSNSKESAWNPGDLGLITGSGRSPGEGMAIHSSILAWKVPWMEEPGGLHPMGLQSQA